MSTLGHLGVNGLLAVNSWIGIINSNLQGSSRTAYKTTRPVLLDGVVNSITTRIQIPSPTLNVQATSIEWGQGAIINSNSRTHFAIQGQGFFVLSDSNGKFYLSRDGEFHWDNQGYLVNSSGLRVISSGQDFIRFGRGDASDIFDPDGQSQELTRYGNKSFLMVDVANRDGLRFSRYGSTVFELDGDLPLRVQNSFEHTTDGLTFLYRDPKQRTYVDTPLDPPFSTTAGNTNFTIDLGGNGLFNFNNPSNPLGAVDFDPATHTIRDIVNAINAYGVANNTMVSATYNAGSDRLEIINIPEPKIADPGFRAGNFAIDFGNNGYFTYRGFDPARTSIADIVNAINDYARYNQVNVTATYNAGADTFTITNTVGGNDEITFDGANASSIASFMQMPLTSNGSVTSATAIDRFPLAPTLNALADISPADLRLPLNDLIHPKSTFVFGGPNGRALEQFFRMQGVTPDIAFDPINGYQGQRLMSSRDIDNSNILDSANAAQHSLDIAAADVAGKVILDYLTTTDTTVPAFDFSGPPPVYFHDEQNGRVISDGTANNGHGLIAIGQAQETDSFDLVMDIHTNTALLGLHFGYNRPEQIDSGGFSVYYNPANGDVTLTIRSRDPNDPPTVLIPTLPAALPIASGLAGVADRLSATLDSDGNFTMSINGAAPVQFSLAGFSQQSSGYLSIGHAGGILQIDNLYADFKGKFNPIAVGEIVGVSLPNYSIPEIRLGNQERERTRVVQSALESSTASLTEYLPMLGLAQKVFSSLSKIISTSSAIQDDINSLIR